MSTHESQTALFDQEDFSSLRMSPVFSVPTLDGTWQSWSARWPTSGSLRSRTELWTASSSVSPNDAGGCSSLPAVLSPTFPSRFLLSPKAARGILRRAEKRGKTIPEALDKALRALSVTGGGRGYRNDLDSHGAYVAGYAPPVSPTVTAKWRKGGGPAGDECQNLVSQRVSKPPAMTTPERTASR